MNDERFDDLTKLLATGPSRRGMLKALGAMAAAGFVSLVGRRHVATAQAPPCQRFGEICRVNVHCCTGTCTDFRCACPPGLPNLCPATQQCLAACPEGRVFNAASCQCECAPDTRQCPGGQCCPTAAQCCGSGCCPEGTVCSKGECIPCPQGGLAPGARCTSGEQCCSGVCSAFTGTCV